MGYLRIMFELGETLVSEELFKRKFVCDLNACKGACCVEGDAGAPLEDEELAELDKHYEAIKPFLRPEGVAAIEEQGRYIKDTFDNEWVTPLVDGKECAYTTFDENGTAFCGIGQAHRAGKVDFIKPVSCHLYPVRVKKYRTFTAVNYDEWDICKPACACGDELNVPVYRFLKTALVRKFGESWFTTLVEVDQARLSDSKNS